MIISHAMQSKSEISFFWERLKNHRKWLFLSAIFAIPYALSQNVTAFFGADFLARTFGEDTKNLLFQNIYLFAIGVVVLFSTQSISDYLHKVFLRVSTERTTLDLRREVFEKLSILSESQRSQYSSGKAISHVINDLKLISDSRWVFQSAIREPITIITLMSQIFFLSWKLTLVVIVGVYPIVFLGKIISKAAKKNQANIQENISVISEHTIDGFQGLRTAHTFNFSKQLKQESIQLAQTLYKKIMKLCRIEESVGPSTKIIFSIFGAVLIVAGNYFVNATNELSDKEFIAYLFSAGLLQQPFREINRVRVRVSTALAGINRVQKLLETPNDPISVSQKTLQNASSASFSPEVSEKASSLEFRNVSFLYPSSTNNPSEKSRNYALNEINFTLNSGQKIALVGPSGSGKSTISLMCLRLYDPTKGEILFRGTALPYWDLQEFRSYFSYVSQDVYLFERTLRENLLVSNPEATDQEIWAALEKANIANFVKKLPDQLNTRLREKGSNLSGGEKQRIAIARAFLKNAPFLILDEATSNLDSNNEKIVQESINELIKNRSVLIIAHRLSTIKNVDKILVIDAGQVAEEGSPSDLLSNQNSSFAKLWNAQFG